jgi:hypothetical protein
MIRPNSIKNIDRKSLHTKRSYDVHPSDNSTSIVDIDLEGNIHMKLNPERIQGEGGGKFNINLTWESVMHLLSMLPSIKKMFEKDPNNTSS